MMRTRLDTELGSSGCHCDQFGDSHHTQYVPEVYYPTYKTCSANEADYFYDVLRKFHVQFVTRKCN
jgi:hypothetical protein